MAHDFTDYTFIPLEPENGVDIYLAYQDAFSSAPLSYNRFCQIVFELLPADSRFSFALTRDSFVLGFLSAFLTSASNLYIILCGVREAYQRTGLLRIMLSYLTARMAAHDVRRVYLDVDADNDAGIRAFTRNGFGNRGKIRNYKFNRGPLENNSLHLIETEKPELNQAIIDEVAIKLLDKAKYWLIYNHSQLIGSVAVNHKRRQILYLHVQEEYSSLINSVFDRIHDNLGCYYIYRVGDDQHCYGLQKFHFSILSEQQTMEKIIRDEV